MIWRKLRRTGMERSCRRLPSHPLKVCDFPRIPLSATQCIDLCQMRGPFPDGIMGGENPRGKEEWTDYGLSTTTACDSRRHLTGAIEPVWLPLAVDASLSGGGATTSVRPLHRSCDWHSRSHSRSRVMDDESVELQGHHRCLCAQPSFGSAGGVLRTDHRDTSA